MSAVTYYHNSGPSPSKVYHYAGCRCVRDHDTRPSTSTEGKRPCAYPECKP